ncbi:MAG TPA: DEAD/DEAH box helicase [Pseudonocardiaceae bacterium]|nr:DEAD/DEAH box helicase [Pseudonocardiaceae bacterium]
MAVRRLPTSPRTTPDTTRRTTVAATAAPVAGPPTFTELGVPAELAAVLAAEGITEAFPIQAATLPDSLAGRDVLGRGRTGSGKTYAFVVPVLARLMTDPRPAVPGRPRALILAPTRELASQIHAVMAPLVAALSLRATTVFGGVPAGRQLRALRAGVDVLVACPGRLADHIAGGQAALDAVEITVIDEADHMADLGFLPVVRRLLDLTPPTGQRLLFSATLDGDVDVLIRRYLTDPVTHSVDSAQSPVPAMTHHVLHVRADSRLPVLVDLTSAPGRTLVFTRTKRAAARLTRQLVQTGVRAVELHGNLAQNVRTRNLAAFANGAATTLVATDIAARGIHIDQVARVIHADPPVEPKAYLHRSGRTARAGAHGTVVTLMTDDQVADVRDLTRKAGIRPKTTRLTIGHALLTEIAPGTRRLQLPPAAPAGHPAGTTRRNPATNTRGDTARSAQRNPRRTRHSANPPTSTSTNPPTNAANPPAAGNRTATASTFSTRSRIGRRGR